METKSLDTPACIKPVKILSVGAAPAMDVFPVGLHYFEDGVYKHQVVKTMRPTYFDEVVVSSVYETLPAHRYRAATLGSAREVARTAVGAAKQMRAAMGAPVAYSEPVLDLRAIPPQNIAHLMTNIVPYSLMARDVVGPGLKVLIQPVGGSFLEVLKQFDITPVWEDRRVTGEMIKISGTRGLAVYDLLKTFDCEGVHFAPEVLLRKNFSAAVGFEKVFLARRAPRNLGNQEEIERIVGAFGYTTIFMEDYSVAEQLSIASQAKHVIAVHGAAMAWLLVNKRLESVVEFLPPNVYHQLFPTCLGARVGRYEQIMPEYDPRVAHSGWEAILYYKNRRFSLDAVVLERVLGEMDVQMAAGASLG